MRKKIYLKMIVSFIIAGILFLYCGLLFLQKTFIPKKLKPLLITTITKSLNQRIDFKDINYIFPQTLIFTDIVVFEKDIPTQKLLTIETAAINFSLPNLLLKKQATVTNIKLKTLQIYPAVGHTFSSRGDIFLKGVLSYRFNDPNNIFYKAIITLKNQEIK